MKKIILLLFTLFCVVGVRAQSDSLAVEKEPEIVDFAEQIPEFPGGQDSMIKFIIENIVYPNKALKEKTQGTVKVVCIVEKDGSLSNIRSVGKEVGGGCDEEAVRVIRMMPKFKPAIQNGNPVRIKMTIPIKFKLQ